MRMCMQEASASVCVSEKGKPVVRRGARPQGLRTRRRLECRREGDNTYQHYPGLQACVVMCRKVMPSEYRERPEACSWTPEGCPSLRLCRPMVTVLLKMTTLSGSSREESEPGLHLVSRDFTCRVVRRPDPKRR